MDAIAPAALALSVSFDAVATLGLVLMSFDGSFLKAMFPRTGDARLDIAAGLGDIMALTLLRGCLVMLPLLGTGVSVSWLGAAVAALAEAAMIGWLAAKAVLLLQLADGRTFLVAATGVKLHLPTVISAEVLGAFMCFFLFALVWVNRAVMQQPAVSGSVALARSQALQQMRARLAVQQWVVTQEPEGVGPELTAPLLAPPPAAAAGASGGGNDPGGGDATVEWDGEAAAGSFVSAHSRQASSNWMSAGSQPSVEL